MNAAHVFLAVASSHRCMCVSFTQTNLPHHCRSLAMFLSPWINGLRKRLNHSRRLRGAPLSRRLNIQKLEPRTLLTTTGVLVGTELSVFVDDGDDIIVQTDATTGRVVVLANGSPATGVPSVAANSITGLNVIAGNDDNDIDVSAVLATDFTALAASGSIRIEGGDGNDSITGSADFGESILGQDGNDTINGGDGNDTIDGGNGNDLLTGGVGADSIDGDDGADTIVGGSGDDVIRGGDGADSITGDAGTDNIDAGQGADFVDGGDDNDTISGMSGNDTIIGGQGNDQVLGGSQNDFISGGDGNDTLDGQGGNDTVDGGDGADLLIGGQGGDSVTGGAGNDTLNGMGGNDSISGGDDPDTIYGGGGRDSLNGDDGNDTINGNGGDDTLEGGAGSDLLRGGAGNDLIGTPSTIAIDDVTVTEGSSSAVFFSTDFDSGVPIQFTGFTNTESVQGYAGVGTGTNLFAGSFLRNDSGGDPSNGGAVPQTPTVLTLTNLPAHTSVDVNFLLAMIGSWNSASDNQGPDFFNVLVNGVSVFNENFRNFAPFPASQGYVSPPGTLLTPNLADLFTAASIPVDNNDTAYNMSLEPAFNDIPHTSSTLTVEWFADGAGFEGQDNESWAIDNVEVVLNGLTPNVEAIFTVSLGGANSSTVTVDFDTVDGSALAGEDYTANSGQLTFAPGETQKTITVPVSSDGIEEGDEFFLVNLSNATSSARIVDAQGVGIIENDDRQLIDVFLVFDSTTSFNAAFPSLAAAFPMIVSDLQLNLPTASFAYGIGRFQEFSGGANASRPFILNQPIVESTTPGFAAATDAAINRAAPNAGNGDIPETVIEALFQVATGLGFDGNGDGDTLDSGLAGLISTQTMPTAGGDVPAFASFLPDGTAAPAGPVLAPSGNNGGVGFRDDSRRLVLLATDAPLKFGVDGVDPYVGVNGVTVPAADIQISGSSAVPAGAAGIQQTVDALIAQNIQVIGLGGITTLGAFDPNDPATAPRRPLESLSILTGAVNQTSSPIVSGIPGDDIDPGEPLYLTIDTASSANIATAITQAILGTLAPPPPPLPPSVPDGDDTLFGDGGNDSLFGGNGNDFINGGDGNDLLGGGLGNDSILGGADNDFIDSGNGNDTIDGQAGDDLIQTGLGQDLVIWNGSGDGVDTIQESAGAQELMVMGGGGADSFSIDSNSGLLRVTEGAASITVSNSTNEVTILGGNGDDSITVSSIDDVRQVSLIIDGQGNNDTITAMNARLGGVLLDLRGGSGNDTITGSRDRETISGNAGDDSLSGGESSDVLDGGDGNDVLNGGLGDDSLDGGSGNDTLNGNDGNDSLQGSFGNDVLMGGVGNDTLRGGFGNDTLNGAAGDDLADGNQDDDRVLGGAGNDSLDGGTGDDTVRGQSGNDQIKGGDGNDRIEGNSGTDTIDGGDGEDTIDAGTGNDIVDGGDGNDAINGMSGRDTLIGGDGNDTLLGGGGVDRIFGGDGADVLRGNGSIDKFNSGEGGQTPKDLGVGETDDQNLTIELSVLAALAELNGF
jgi:Ca2+-binding RTX toxin-like protein